MDYSNPTPKERLLEEGPAGLTDLELISILTGHRIDAAERVMDKAGTVADLMRWSPKELMREAVIGHAAAAQIFAAYELGRRATRQKSNKQLMDSPEAVFDLLAGEMQSLVQESLKVILLDTRFRLMRVDTVSIGTVNESLADPREVFRPAIVHNAYGMILAHNHPSGNPSPSDTDRRMTERMREVANIHRIRLLDHVIIGRRDTDHPAFFSFREHGLL